GGAGLDVLEGERMLKDEMALVRGGESIQDLKSVIRDHILIDMPNVVVTPHIAFFSKEAYGEILSITAKNILDFQKGNPANIV
ncbi:MAG: hydroxyacid dehydrogenase, partial [Patescibacteria group bacterium]